MMDALLIGYNDECLNNWIGIFLKQYSFLIYILPKLIFQRLQERTIPGVTLATWEPQKLCLVFSPKDGASNAFCCRSWVICTSRGMLKLEAPYIFCYVSKLQVRFKKKSKKKQKREVSGMLRVRSGTILFTLQCPMGWACLALGCQEGSSIACCGWSFELITTRGPPRPS